MKALLANCHGTSSNRALIIGLSVGLSVAAIALAVAGVVYFKKRRAKNTQQQGWNNQHYNYNYNWQ